MAYRTDNRHSMRFIIRRLFRRMRETLVEEYRAAAQAPQLSL